MSDKHWTDQPDDVLGKPVRLRMHVNGRSIEVRDDGDAFLLTQGTLFGSQTIRCENAIALLTAMHKIANVKKTPDGVTLPDGCTLLS